jgi:hypothetical protein
VIAREGQEAVGRIQRVTDAGRVPDGRWDRRSTDDRRRNRGRNDEGGSEREKDDRTTAHTARFALAGRISCLPAGACARTAFVLRRLSSSAFVAVSDE